MRGILLYLVMNEIQFTYEELFNMRGVIFGRRLQSLGEDIDEVEFVKKMLEIRTELMETSDEQIIKDYKKLLN